MYCFRIYGHISFWNTSSITNMDKLFQFTDFSCDLNRWDTSNVDSMSATFSNSTFKQGGTTVSTSYQEK